MSITIVQTGYKLPQTIISNGAITGNAWSNADNLLLVDHLFAESTPGAGSASDVTIGNFNFNVPSNATITGIQMQVLGYRGGETVPPIALSPIAVDDLSGTPLFYPYTPIFTGLTDTYAEYTIGGDTNLFGTTWTPDQVNNLKLQLNANGDIYLDGVLVSVLYYLPEVTPPTPPVGTHCLDCNSQIQANPFKLSRDMNPSDTVMYLESFNYPDGTPIENTDVGACGGYFDFVIDQGKEKNPDGGGNFTENVTSPAMISRPFGSDGEVKVDFNTIDNRGLGFSTPYAYSVDRLSGHNSGAEVVLSNSGKFYDRFLKKCHIDVLVSGPIEVDDEGTSKTNHVHKMNFVGTGVTVTVPDPSGHPDDLEIDIPGNTLDVLDEGTSIDSAVTHMNFTGGGVTATEVSPGHVEVHIPTPASGVLLETNGSVNANQAKLNLVAGSNVSLTDDGAGNVTIASTGGGGGSGGSGAGIISRPETRIVTISGTGISTPFDTYSTGTNAGNLITDSGTLKNLTVNVELNSHTGTNYVTVYKNGVATTLKAAITAGTTGIFFDSTHTVSVVAGDIISLVLDATASASGTSTFYFSYEFTLGSAGNSTITKTAARDITAGQLVGISAGDEGYASLALDIQTAFTTTFGTNIVNGQFIEINTDKFAMLMVDTVTNEEFVVVGTLNRSTNVITWGTKVSVSTSVTSGQSSIAKIDVDKFIVAYASITLKAKVGTVSGTTITLGSSADSTVTFTVGVSVASGSTNHASIVWNERSGGGNDTLHSIACTVSGTAITFGSAVTVLTTTNPVTIQNMNYDALITIGTDTFALALAMYNVATDIRLVVLNQSGTIISHGTVQSVTTGGGNGSIQTLFSKATNEFCFAYNTNSASWPVYYATVSGTVITLGTPITGMNGGAYWDGTYINMIDASNNTQRYTVSGTTFTIAAQGPFNFGGFPVYTSNGYNIFISLSANTGSFSVTGMSNNFVGVATNTVSRGGTVSIQLSGEATISGQNINAGSLYSVRGYNYTLQTVPLYLIANGSPYYNIAPTATYTVKGSGINKIIL